MILKENPRYKWVILAMALLLYTTWGVISRSIAPLVTPILQDLNLNYSQMGTILGAWPLTYIGVALVAGALMDRWGIRRSIFLGIIVIGLSEALRYFASGFVTMLVFVALFGLGGPLISIGCPKTISQWFQGKSRRVAVAIYTLGPALGSLIAYSMTNSVVMPLTGYSWRLTFIAYSLLAFGAGLLWWLLARDAPASVTREEAGVVNVFQGLIRLRKVQVILLLGFITFAINHGFNGWLPKLLESRGLPAVTAGYLASLPWVVAIPAVLLLPSLVSDRRRSLAVALLSVGVTTGIVLITVPNQWSLITGLLLFGASYSCILPMLTLFLMEMPEVGAKNMGSAAGMFFCAAEMGGFAGPFIVGAFRDLSGDFFLGVYLLAFISFCRVFLCLPLRNTAGPGSPEQG